MSKPTLKTNEYEQKICMVCGFCCDGTLFLYGNLNTNELGHLPRKIEQNRFTKEDKEYFRQPCPYFIEKCTIYNKNRPDVCSVFRCRLLRDFEGGKISTEEALEIVREAFDMRKELLNKYSLISVNHDAISFRVLLAELGKILNSLQEENELKEEYGMLQVRCNIFQALLIKYFRSAGDFENIMDAK